MKHSDLWTDLSQELRKKLEPQSSLLEFKRGDLVYSQGDKPKGMFFVEQGLVGLMKVGISGKEHLLRFFRQGHFFGHRSLFSKEDYHGSAIVLQATKLRFVPQEVLLSVLQKEPQFLFEIVRVLAKELRHCEDQHVMILDNQINVRVAQAVVYLKDLHPQHNWTRQEIANFCASTVSTVIKAMADLEAQGLIRQEGRTIEILDREKLVALQDETI